MKSFLVPIRGEQARINRVVGHPQVFRSDKAETERFCFEQFRLNYDSTHIVRQVSLEREIPILGISLPDGFMVAIAYLTPHPAVEAAIASGHVRRLGDDLALESRF